MIADDGWSGSWATETGWKCTGGSITSVDIWTDICGDGIRFSSNSAYWDDGNMKSSDGCSRNWTIETGWKCTGGTITSSDNWTEICGDGIRFNSNSKYWDDGNLINGDGCTSACNIESGFTCTGGSATSKDIWTAGIIYYFSPSSISRLNIKSWYTRLSIIIFSI